MAKHQATTPSLQIDAQTLSFLGISQQPFTATILAGDAIYTDATRDQMIATLQHHMQFSDLVLIVEGEQDSGKTTLFRQLIQNSIPNLFLISMQAEPTDTLVQLQQKMSAHLKSQGSANYLDQDLKNLQVFDQFPIVIIDDAHLLSDTTLQELLRYRSQLKRDKDTNLKILLFANPGMSKTLEDISDLQHNQLYVQQMPELSPKQVQAFIDHRLVKAGYRGSTVLPPETIQLIHKKSAGNPGRIMALAALMLDKHVRNFYRGNSNLAVKILGIVGVLLLAAGSAYFWLHQTPVPAPPVMTSESPETATDDALFAADESTSPAETSSIESPEQNPQSETIEQADSITSIDTPDSMTAAEIPAEPDIPPTEPDLSTSGIAPPSAARVTPLSDPTADQHTTASSHIPAPAPAPAPDTTTAQSPVINKPVTPDTTPVKVDNQEVTAELATLGIKDSNWLRQQNPAHWTLQVLGARDTSTLLKFVREHKLGEDTAWYTTQLNGKPWYVLVHRFYTSADIARKGLTLLPPDIQRGHPWVKSMAAIQKDMSK